MVRASVATALVVTWVGVAHADPGRKITVDSDPKGAVVYVEEKEAGPACPGTPCTITVPTGEVTLIIELKDHASQFESIVVPKRGKPPKVSVTLPPAVGTIVVEGPPGATISVDDVESGKAPANLDASEETHHVVVSLNGKTLFDDFVEVKTGQETTIQPKQVAGGGGGGGGGGDGTDGGDGDPSVGRTTKAAGPKRARDRFVSASAAVDIGFRHFSYSGVETPQKLRDESESGQVLAGPLVELWPGELTDIAALRGLSLLARLQFGINSQDVTGNGIMDKTNTFWQSMEFSLRYRKTFAGKFTAEAGAGYVRDQYQFEGTTTDLALVPDVDYQSVRLGLRASVLLDKLEPYVTIENRVVSSGGRLAQRFAAGSDASGYRASAGINAMMGSFVGRVEAGLINYSWDLKFDPSSDMRATGATDSIKQIQIAIGYQY